MQENIKIIAVLTEEGSLNIHLFGINHIEVTMKEEGMDDECEAMEFLLSRSYNLSSIQWQEIERIKFNINCKQTQND